MSRPRLLDLFCGAGGAAQGYHEAGFDVVGVDKELQPNYPFPYWRMDALEFLRHAPASGWMDFDAIHASPPCQRFTAMRTMWNHKGDEHPDLIAPTRALLEQSGLPWVMENVPGAPLNHSVMLCGTMFGLGVKHHDRELRRHRLFETTFPLLQPQCQHSRATIGIYGDHARDRRRGNGARGSDFPDRDKIALAQEALGMPWVTRWRGLSEAIPPAYTRFIGEELLRQLGSDRASHSRGEAGMEVR